jgi:hypothetical protein
MLDRGNELNLKQLENCKEAIYKTINESGHAAWAEVELSKRASGDVDAGWRSAAKVGTTPGDIQWMAQLPEGSPLVRQTESGPLYDMASIRNLNELPPTWQKKNSGSADLVYGLLEESVRKQEPLTDMKNLVDAACKIHDNWLGQSWNKPNGPIQAMSGEQWTTILSNPMSSDFHAVAEELRKDLPNLLLGLSLALGKPELKGIIQKRFDEYYGLTS